MPRLLKAYLASGVLMLAIDAVWLTVMADRFYRPQIGHLMRTDGFAVAPAVGFYLVYLAGIAALVQLPAANWLGALWRGAVYGFCAYATYDLTNQATLRDWPWLVTAVDILWGSALTATVAAGGYAIAKCQSGNSLDCMNHL